MGSAAGDSGLCGTPGYIPPETWERKKWYPRGDLFSLGGCIMQLLTGKLIFVDGCRSVEEIGRAVRTRTPPFHLMPAAMQGLTRLVQKLLEKKLLRRPTT